MMQPNALSRYLLAGVLVPGTVMLGIRYFGQGATQSQASAIPFVMPDLVLLPEIPLASSSADQSIQIDRVIDSPFWFEDLSKAGMDSSIFNITGPVDSDIEDELFGISVTSILPHPKNPLAIINSKPRRIGDDVMDGWKLISIDGKSRTLVLRHVTGKRVTLGLTP